jgi:fructose-1-phosphate kinase PfkB-like protein
VALWNGTGSQLASCPIQENLYFGIRDVAGLTDELAVTSSDGSLPDPETCGSNSFEDVIADLKYTGNFTMQDISHEDLSQIIRAGWGAPRIRPTTGAAD